MINPRHPSAAHISAVRAWRFAQELATLGHRVVFLTATDASGTTTACLAHAHDWRRPYVLACAASDSLTRAYPSRLPRFLRRARTAFRLLFQGGESVGWMQAAVLAGTRLPPGCGPDVLWCTFGQMDAVFAARSIARRLRRPWVLDLKDNWELYVPRGLRRLMVWRTRGAAAVTVNAKLTQGMAHKWQGVAATLIYSGVEECFFSPQGGLKPANFEINVVGGIYFPELLRSFLEGIKEWYRDLSPQHRARVCLRHIGAQRDLVRRIAHELMPGLTLDMPGYVSTEEMAGMCQRACVNAYVKHSGTFHHKLLELLACGRPVIAYPTEGEEAIALAAPAREQLIIATSPKEVSQVLSDLSAPFFECGAALATYPRAHLRSYSWPAQALLLRQVLTNAASLR